MALVAFVFKVFCHDFLSEIFTVTSLRRTSSGLVSTRKNQVVAHTLLKELSFLCVKEEKMPTFSGVNERISVKSFVTDTRKSILGIKVFSHLIGGCLIICFDE